MSVLLLKDVPPSVELVWHYSKGIHLTDIIKSGKLLPATAGVPAPEKPVLWFTSSPVYPPSACPGELVDPESMRTRRVGRKLVADAQSMKTRTLSVAETAARYGGVIRFGVDAGLTLSWREVQEAARISPAMVRALESVARKQGEDPNDWRGIVGALPIAHVLTLDIDETGSGAWVSRHKVAGETMLIAAPFYPVPS